jgi:hypothetical protein
LLQPLIPAFRISELIFEKRYNHFEAVIIERISILCKRQNEECAGLAGRISIFFPIRRNA